MLVCKENQKIWALLPNPFKKMLIAEQWEKVLDHYRKCETCQINNYVVIDLLEKLSGKNLKSELQIILPPPEKQKKLPS